jgi:hypothetical protein
MKRPLQIKTVPITIHVTPRVRKFITTLTNDGLHGHCDEDTAEQLLLRGIRELYKFETDKL